MVLIGKTAKPEIHNGSVITFKMCGNIAEAVYMSKRNHGATVIKISKEQYIQVSTGEVKNYEHRENRKDNISEVRRSLKRLRDYINTNATTPANCQWITLTYAENMTDTKQLYSDFKKFIMRYRYYLGENPEYIVAMEPQGRGAWHAHLLTIFDHTAPFVPNKILRELWGHGFVKITALDDIDNIGAYLTAYLGDMELNEAENIPDSNIKEVKINGKSKRFIKGGRLSLYPTGFNLYRISKGIKPPIVEQITEKKLQEITAEIPITYEKAIKLTFDEIDPTTGEPRELIIYYRHYNLRRKAVET